MTDRYFTREDAQEMVGWLEETFQALAPLRDTAKRLYDEIRTLERMRRSNGGGKVSEMLDMRRRDLAKTTERIQEEIRPVRERGLVVKSIVITVDRDTELRLFQEENAEEELALWRENVEEYLRWFPGDYESKTLDSTREWIRSNLERFSNNGGFAVGIWHLGELAGVIDLQKIDWDNKKSGLGYWLGATFQGKGLMTKSCRAITDHAFDKLKLNRIEIRCAPENTKSCAVAERLGFRREGVLRQNTLVRDRCFDDVVYAMLADEWYAAKTTASGEPSLGIEEPPVKIDRKRQRQYMESNRRNWNERTPVHARSDFYDVEGFKAGAISLCSIELEEMGDVTGESLLHLQCHFGMDTMSWARLGATATGVDFSEEAISLARSLSRELRIDAEFVLSNIYDLPDVLHRQFDVVFTSYGVLVWLPDLKRWAEVIARFLKPGGVFYIVDFHPFGNVFYDEEDATDLRPYYNYSDRATDPIEFAPGPTYTDGSTKLLHTTYEWNHSVSNILQLVDLGRSNNRLLPRVPLLRIPSFADDGEG